MYIHICVYSSACIYVYVYIYMFTHIYICTHGFKYSFWFYPKTKKKSQKKIYIKKHTKNTLDLADDVAYFAICSKYLSLSGSVRTTCEPATHCNALQHTNGNTLQHTATHCATHCNTLTAAHSNTMQHQKHNTPNQKWFTGNSWGEIMCKLVGSYKKGKKMIFVLILFLFKRNDWPEIYQVRSCVTQNTMRAKRCDRVRKEKKLKQKPVVGPWRDHTTRCRLRGTCHRAGSRIRFHGTFQRRNTCECVSDFQCEICICIDIYIYIHVHIYV